LGRSNFLLRAKLVLLKSSALVTEPINSLLRLNPNSELNNLLSLVSALPVKFKSPKLKAASVCKIPSSILGL